jgi:hypothetical protein
MPAVVNGSLTNGHGGPGVVGRNGTSSFINGKGNASAKGNGIAQMNGNGSVFNEFAAQKAKEGYKAINGANGAAKAGAATLGRAEEVDDVSCRSLLDRQRNVTKKTNHGTLGSSLVPCASSLSPSSRELITPPPRSTPATPTGLLLARNTMSSLTTRSPRTLLSVSIFACPPTLTGKRA